MSQQSFGGEPRAGRSWGTRLARLLRLRLFVPILRRRGAPEHTARGVFVGLLVALTPTVGAQMLIVAAIWAAIRRLRPQWDFNLLVACAWTWTTNVVTVPPVYYVFLVTGRLMVGEWSDAPAFADFVEHLRAMMQVDMDFLTSLWLVVWEIFARWGLPMLIGCVPWAIAGAVLGYCWSLRLMRRFRRGRGAALAASWTTARS